jgi:hypothetical protein
MRNDLNTGIVRDAGDCDGTDARPCELPIDSEKWIFPIPNVEINANPNMTQAPGY